ncbi:MAG: DUF1573 domain-containing protein [Lewinella sp.]|nr:DUF1573 domain-containing protein [Lewinella sp.]
MLKQFKTALLAVLVVAFLASCQSANNDVRNQAREDVTTATPAAPAASSAMSATTPPAPTGPTTTMAFEELTFDFGTVAEGEKVSHTYKFTNTGNEPLVLSDAKGSCGCTVPKWPKDPIAPGATGKILVEFNSKGKKNKQNKKVTITANTEPAQSFLYIKGDVTPEPGSETPATNVQVQ